MATGTGAGERSCRAGWGSQARVRAQREQILFAARSVETEPSLIGFSDHLIAAATRP
jgi:hypothetical protein